MLSNQGQQLSKGRLLEMKDAALNDPSHYFKCPPVLSIGPSLCVNEACESHSLKICFSKGVIKHWTIYKPSFIC